MRFKTQERKELYINHMQNKMFANVQGNPPRRLTVKSAPRDLEFNDNRRPAGPQYYDDVWIISEGNMQWR